ncbi:hypothetical protein SY88_12550 [Clostridiales bacterium PH28_bin88]|nr:hypothetical protein SY88_12550 [Clostridiales bacterium PH28_bin88]
MGINIEEIKKKITNVWPDAKVIVQTNTVSGYNVKVVSNQFKGIQMSQRNKLITGLLPDLELAFLETLTEEEDHLFGTDLSDLAPEDYPLWAEVTMAGPQRYGAESPSLFGQTDDEPSRPIITTFYSIKGGVGRTTALAYTAYWLASKGYSVITIDMDLEAPGLKDFFGSQTEVGPLAFEGLVGLFHEIESNSGINVKDYMIRVDGKELYCLPAGNVSKSYVQLLRDIKFDRYYRLAINPLRKLIDLIKQQMEPDVILVDARTGIAELNAPLLFDLADIAVILFFPHPQAKSTFELLISALLSSKNKRGVIPQPRFVITPVPPSDQNQRIYKKGIEWVEEVASRIRDLNNDPEMETFISNEVTAEIKYDEAIAFSDSVIKNQHAIMSKYRAISEWIEKYLDKGKEVDVSTFSLQEKMKILRSLEFSTGKAEEQKDLVKFFIKTEDYFKTLDQRTVLIVGRKGTGKTALFKMLLEGHYLRDITYKDIEAFAIMAPPEMRKDKWYLEKESFRAIEKHLFEHDQNWSGFWGAYILIRLCLQFEFMTGIEELDHLVEDLKARATQVQLVETLKRFVTYPNFSLILNDKLRDCDDRLEKMLYLLFDGLDTGFGSEAKDLARRIDAIKGLFQFWYEVKASLNQIRFKIFLRKDIWDRILFQNKSHIWGQDIRLTWDQVNFLKTICKQALQSDELGDYLRKSWDDFPDNNDSNIEEWDALDVERLINVLVGERMKGGNTTFTKNWIWNRLGDGKGDRSPRFLFQLLLVAKEEEEKTLKSERTPYLRSLIRPRMLVLALQRVSEEAIGALMEEYPELIDFTEKCLKGNQSPFFTSEISREFQDVIEGAREAGLIYAYEEEEGNTSRYAVPDLYLKGLNMTRKGQA